MDIEISIIYIDIEMSIRIYNIWYRNILIVDKKKGKMKNLPRFIFSLNNNQISTYR